MTRRSHRGLSAVAGLVLLTPLIGACGGSDSPPEASADAPAAASEPAETAPAASEPAAPEPEASEPDAAAGGIPDPCEVIPADQLTALTGADNGAGTSNGDASSVRRYCIYASGLSTSIVRGTEFESSVAVMRSDPNLEEVADLPGLGDQAIIGSYGGGTVRQLMVLQGDYFVTVTGALSEAQATATAQALLNAL